MIFLLYLIQSLFYGFYVSLPLTYTQIPDYRTLSVFAAAGLPYSLKFIMGRYSIIQLHLKSDFTSKHMERERPGSSEVYYL